MIGRPFLIGSVFLALLSWGSLSPAIADPAFGDWWTEDRDAIVRLADGEDGIEGKIIWLEEPNHEDDHERAGEPVLDENNPDEEKRARPILGIKILWGFEHHDEGEWREGSVYDPNNGRTYRARLRMTEEGQLNLRGYVGRPIFGRSSEWTRVDEDWPNEGAYHQDIDKDES